MGSGARGSRPLGWDEASVKGLSTDVAEEVAFFWFCRVL